MKNMYEEGWFVSCTCMIQEPVILKRRKKMEKRLMFMR